MKYSSKLNTVAGLGKKGWPWEEFEHPIMKREKSSFPKITIITPSFNQGNFIETTIRSVIFQRYPNLEYIIIDGGSTDNTVEIIKQYEPWITFWVSEKDKGQSDAINKGLKYATGEIINWLNSDDYYEPGALFKIADYFHDNDTLMVGGRSFLFTDQNNKKEESSGTDIYINNLSKTLGWVRIDQPVTFFRKRAVDIMGPLNTQLHYLMDRDWWFKYLLNFGLSGVKRVPDFFVNFRLHDESKTVSQGEKFQIEHDSYFYKLAIKAKLYYLGEIIKTNTIVKDYFDLDFDLKELNLIEQALHYYLLLRADQFYVNHNKAKTNDILKSIDLRFLKKEDEELWRKIYYRNKFIPSFVLELFRKK